MQHWPSCRAVLQALSQWLVFGDGESQDSLPIAVKWVGWISRGQHKVELLRVSHRPSISESVCVCKQKGQEQLNTDCPYPDAPLVIIGRPCDILWMSDLEKSFTTNCQCLFPLWNAPRRYFSGLYTMDGAHRSLSWLWNVAQIKLVSPEMCLDGSCIYRHGTKYSCFSNIFPVLVRSEIATYTRN